MAALCAMTLMIASSCNYCRPTRVAPGETLGSGLPNLTMAALRCCFSLGSIVCGAALADRGRRWSGYILHGVSVEMSCNACPIGATLFHVCSVGAQHILQRLQAVSVGGTSRHGGAVYQRRPQHAHQFMHREVVSLGAVVASTDFRTGKDDADLFH